MRIVSKEDWIYYLIVGVVALVYFYWKRKIRGIKKDKDIPLIIFLVIFIIVAASIVIHFFA